MNELDKDKLRAELLKQCDLELKIAKKIEDENERNLVIEELFNRYQKALLTIGVSSWKSLINIEKISND